MGGGVKCGYAKKERGSHRPPPLRVGPPHVHKYCFPTDVDPTELRSSAIPHRNNLRRGKVGRERGRERGGGTCISASVLNIMPEVGKK